MKVARWYYVKEPVFPPRVGLGAQFHHPAMYAEIVDFVKEVLQIGTPMGRAARLHLDEVHVI